MHICNLETVNLLFIYLARVDKVLPSAKLKIKAYSMKKTD